MKKNKKRIEEKAFETRKTESKGVCRLNYPEIKDEFSKFHKPHLLTELEEMQKVLEKIVVDEGEVVKRPLRNEPKGQDESNEW